MQENKQRGSASLAIKAGFWYVVSTFLVRGMGFLTTPVFSRLMTKEHYGEFSTYASWQAILVIITGAELHNTVARAYYDFKEDFDGYVSTVTFAGCALTAAFYLLFLLCGEGLFRIVSIPERFVHILFFTLMCQTCKSIYLARERTLYRYKSVAALSAFIVAVPTLIAVAMVALAQEQNRLDARIYGFYLPTALVGLYCAFVMLRRRKSFKVKYLKYAFVLSLPLMVHYLTAHLLTSSNTIVTKAVLGSEAVAVVSVASSANHILTIFLQAVSGALTTWLMDNLENNNLRRARKGTLAYTGGIAALGIGVMLLAPEVVWILGGKQYAQSTALMPGMVVSALVQSATTVFTIVLTYKKRVKTTALFTAVVAALCIAAKVYLLPRYGVMTLPYINIAAFGMLFAVNYLLVRKAGGAKAVHIRGMLLILLAAMAVMLGCGYLYEHSIVRYAIVAVCALAVCAAAYQKRSVIIPFIKKKFGAKMKKTTAK